MAHGKKGKKTSTKQCLPEKTHRIPAISHLNSHNLLALTHKFLFLKMKNKVGL
jgi:hypothetical protein